MITDPEEIGIQNFEQTYSHY